MRCDDAARPARHAVSVHGRRAATRESGKEKYLRARSRTTLSVTVDLFTFLELIGCAAVRTDGAARLHDLDIDARVHAPQRRLGAGTVDGKVFGFDVDDVALLYGGVGCAAHLVS